MNQITSIGGSASEGANGSLLGSGGYAINGVIVPNSNLNGNTGLQIIMNGLQIGDTGLQIIMNGLQIGDTGLQIIMNGLQIGDRVALCTRACPVRPSAAFVVHHSSVGFFIVQYDGVRMVCYFARNE